MIILLLQQLILRLSQLFYYITSMVVIVLVLLYILFTTSFGLHFSLEMAKKMLPGQLTIEAAKGTLTNMDVTDLQYKNKNVAFMITHLQLAWQPHLFARKLVILNLQADTIHINTNNSASESSSNVFSPSLHPLSLVKYLDIQHMQVTHFQLCKNNQLLFQFKQLTMAHKKNVLNAYLTQGNATASIHGMMNKTWQWHWKINVPNLTNVYLKMQGQLYSQGNLSGNMNKPHIEANVGVTHFKWGEIAIAELKLQSQSNLQGTNNNINSQILFIAKKMDIASLRIPLIQIQLEPIITHKRLTINATIHRLWIPHFNTSIQDIKLQTAYDSNQVVTLNGEMAVGGGHATFAGEMQLHQPTLPATLTLDGEALHIANSSEYNIIASPHLTLHYTTQKLELSGKISIPKANIIPVDLSSTVTLPSEVIFVNQSNHPVAIPPTLNLQVDLLLGNQVNIQYQRLKATLRGNLSITQRSNSLPTATGQLYTSNGRYAVYGKTLVIQQGRIIYAGNTLSNPGLDIRAISKINTIGFNQNQFTNGNVQATNSASDQITVGVWIQGTLHKPTLTLFSDPPDLSQNDILSYLIFGYPASQASGINALTLLQLLPNLSNGSSPLSDITNTIQNKLGLSELSIGNTQVFDPTNNTSTNATTISVAKSLGHRLSLRYSVGLFNTVSILNIRYQLNKHWSIQSETSSIENGGDIIYQYSSGN